MIAKKTKKAVTGVSLYIFSYTFGILSGVWVNPGGHRPYSMILSVVPLIQKLITLDNLPPSKV